MDEQREDLGSEAYRRVLAARKWNTSTAVFAVVAIGALVYWEFYNDTKVLVGLGLGLVGILVYSVHGFFVDWMNEVERERIRAVCPRCGAVIEEKALIDAPMPKECGKCGLEIKDDRLGR